MLWGSVLATAMKYDSCCPEFDGEMVRCEKVSFAVARADVSQVQEICKHFNNMVSNIVLLHIQAHQKGELQ